MFRDAGAVIAPPMTSPQLRDAMREGKMDGLITTLESLVGFRIYEHAKSATIGGLGNFVNFQPLLISKAVWDGLTVDEKYALESAAEATEGYFYSVQREAERNAIEAFTNAGARMHRVGLDEYESWIRMSKDSAWPAYRALSPVADELFVALLTSLIQSGKGDPAAGGSRGN